MAKIAKRCFEGTAKDGSAATYHYEVAEDEQGNLVCLACGAPCEYHPTDMGIEGIWVAVGPCPKCGLNTQYADEGLWEACAEYDNYKGECLICSDGIQWGDYYGDEVVIDGFYCASCGAACEVGKRLPRGENGLFSVLDEQGWYQTHVEGNDTRVKQLPDGRYMLIERDNAGNTFFSILTPCDKDAARAAALANEELAKHGLPLIGVDAE